LEINVLPDMEDFEEETLSPEAISNPEVVKLSLREKLGIRDNDLMVVMPTRVVPRKAIEFAIEFTERLQRPEYRQELEQIGAVSGVGNAKRKFDSDGKIFLVLPQGEDLTDSQDYADALTALAREKNVELIFAGEHVRPDSKQVGDEDQRVPFYSVYDEADLVIYPTVGEGFGNQLLEIVKKYKLPILFEYEVFKSDILPYLPHYVSLGDTWEWSEQLQPSRAKLRVLPEEAYEKAIAKMLEFLKDPEKLQQAVAENRVSMASQFDSKVVTQRFLQQIGVVVRNALTPSAPAVH